MERIFVDDKTGEEYTEQSLWDNFISFATDYSEEEFLEWVAREGMIEKIKGKKTHNVKNVI